MPESMDTYIAVGMFWVYPGMFPANIKVDPNSSNALPKLTIALEMIALSERNGNNHNAPSTRSAFSISSSMASSPVLEDWYKKGKATTVEEITRAYLVNITVV